MSLHPTPAHWFETYVPRAQTVYVLEALADTGKVELDKDLVTTPVVDTAQLRHTIRSIEDLRLRYSTLLPTAAASHLVVSDTPERTSQAVLRRLRHWLAQQLCLQRRQRRLQAERDNLDLLQECLNAMGTEATALASFGHPSTFLYKRIFACPPDCGERIPVAGRTILEVYTGPRHEFHIVAGLPEGRPATELTARLQHCRAVEVPHWLAADWPRREALLTQRQSALAADLAAMQQALAGGRADPKLRADLNDAAVLHWYLEHTITLTEDHHYCHVTGWTTAAAPQELQAALRAAHIEAVILFRPGPPGRQPPVVANRSWWANPFRLFVDMLGTPGQAEFDPAALLAVIVPILFGFMFPDVGHGLVLAAGGLLLSRRHARLKFLVPCGLAAAGFGVLFGETFGLHEPIPALWLRPLDHPILVLLAPLGLGALVILAGLFAAALEAHWRGELGRWLLIDAAVPVFCVGAFWGLFHRAGWIVMALAAVWSLCGLLVTCRRPYFAYVAGGLGRLLASALELGLNTLSFLRVGAFALAHAALSQTLLGLVETVESPAFRVALLLVGHAAIILVEGLVVFVQTTRLILFEFFIRFLHAEGRLFRPLPSASGTVPRRRGD